MKTKLFSFVMLLSLLASCSKTSDLKDDLKLQKQIELTINEAKALSTYLNGSTVSKDDVMLEAESIIDLLDGNSTRSSSRKIKDVIILENEKNVTRSHGEQNIVDTMAYIVNFADNLGYVVLSADRRTDNILALSEMGNLDVSEDDIPSGLAVYFANAETLYEQQIIEAKTQQNELLESALAKLSNNDIQTRATSQTAVYSQWENYNEQPYLVKVRWGQDSPYNDNAPLINGGRAAAGCVATAIAQVMSYHEFPTYYNWEEINKLYYPSTPTAKSDVARMFRTIGDNVSMNWGLPQDGGSGAQTVNARTHFTRMGYKNIGTMKAYNHNGVISNINNLRPVILRGNSYMNTYTHRHWFLGKKHTHTEYSGGHAWVVDGYLTRRRSVSILSNGVEQYKYYETQTLVHCNWGWSSSYYNGYYNSGAFSANKGPVTRAGESNNYQFNIEYLDNISPF
ncbi:MAG: C10 family peptidase [Rikenellaceae bacterium]